MKDNGKKEEERRITWERKRRRGERIEKEEKGITGKKK